jgi:O-antigen ligase
MVFILGWVYSLPSTASKITNSYVFGRSIDGTLEVIGYGWASSLELFANITAAFVAGLAAVLIVRQKRRYGRSRVGLVLVALVAVGVIVTSLHDGAFPTGQPLLLIALLLAASALRTSAQAIAAGAAFFVLSFGVVSSGLALVNESAAVLPCTAKCTVFGSIFTGAASHENALALLVTVGIPFVWLAFKGRTKVWLMSYLLFIVVATGSRTSLASAVIVCIVILATNPTISAGKINGKNPHILGFATLAAISISLVLPFTDQQDTFATGRGYLWRLAIEGFLDNPLAGAGQGAWQKLYESGVIGAPSAYSTHNQWTEVLLISGISGFIILSLALIMALYFGGNQMFFATAPIIMTVFFLGILERPFSISLVNTLSWALVALVLLAGSQQPGNGNNNHEISAGRASGSRLRRPVNSDGRTVNTVISPSTHGHGQP